MVSNIVPRDIVHHNPLVEGMEAKEAILPALLLASNIVRIEAAELDDGCGILGRRNTETRCTVDGS